MKNPNTSLLSMLCVALGIAPTTSIPSLFPRGRTVSEVQKRMHAKWETDAPRRAQVAREIAIWNAGVKRRNRAFAVTGKNKFLRA